MDTQTKKDYVKKFVCEGMPLDKAFALTYCDESEIQAIKQDQEFMEEINCTLLQLTLNRVNSYNIKVDSSDKPSDELRRLSSVMEVIDTEALDMPGDLNLTIIKQRGEK